MEFVPVGEMLEGKHTGKHVAVRGWIHRERKQKTMCFFVVRDDSGVIQSTVRPESKAWQTAQEVTIESSVEVSGTVKEDKRAPGGYELQVDSLEVIGLAERFPITKDQSEEFLRDVRHLWIRSRKQTLIFKIRSAVTEAIHGFYKQKGYFEVQSPIFTRTAAEGGSTLFEVRYFDEKAYLAQTWQLYAEAMIFALQKIYTVAPSFRAEKSRTRRHLSEYWHHEMETAWMGFEELLKFEEELIVFVSQYVADKCAKELKELGRDVEELKRLSTPFARMKYEEALKKLGKKWGDDLTDEDERKLVADMGKPVFITHFPREMKAFYMKVDTSDKRVVLAADLLIPGVGELIGGSERISDLKELEESMELFKLDRREYEWYLDLRRFGTVQHSGFGLGIERLVMWLSGAEHIMDTIPFPRTMTRLYP